MQQVLKPSEWGGLAESADKVFGFLESCDANRIGKGLVRFDKDHFRLQPRSDYFDNKQLQSLVSLGDVSATFDATQEALGALDMLVESIAVKVLRFNPQNAEECPSQSRDFLTQLIKINRVVEGVSKIGLNQLKANYATSGKSENAATLGTLGEKAFKKLTEVEEHLTKALVPFFPDLAEHVVMEKLFISTKELLARRELNCAHMRQVTWTAENGTIVPSELVVDCSLEWELDPKPTKQALRNAATYLMIPSKAKPIPAQGGAARWVPLRPKTDSGRVIIEEGVSGTCERSGTATDNLCNLYYCDESQASQVMLSSGTVDTTLKAAQLIEAIVKIQVEKRSVKGRWILHSLNSFFKEEDLLNGIQHNLPILQESLKTKLGRSDISVHHLNTCFNAATMYPYEDARSVSRINGESLVALLDFAFADLTERTVADDGELVHEMIARLDEIRALAEEVRQIKNRINGNSAYRGVEQLLSLENQILSSREALSLSELRVEEESGEPSVQSVQDLETQRINVEASLPQGVIELKNLLFQKQSRLEELLRTKGAILLGEVIDALAQREKSGMGVSLELSLLSFRVLRRIFAVQFKEPLSQSMSRSGEIECFLLLYRLLNVNVLVLCKSGLDRSAEVRALSDAQSQVERLFYRQHLQILRGDSEVPWAASSLEARKQLFDLILTMDQNRNELLRSAAVLENDRWISAVRDWKAGAQLADVRSELMRNITSRNSVEVADRFKNTLLYLELVLAHLLGTESEKTINSTGIAGLKYMHGGGLLDRMFANFHALDRLPPFIQVDGRVIKLITLSEGYIYNSLLISEMGIVLIQRLSLLRGH